MFYISSSLLYESICKSFKKVTDLVNCMGNNMFIWEKGEIPEKSLDNIWGDGANYLIIYTCCLQLTHTGLVATTFKQNN